MLIAHRIALDPTNVQQSRFAQASGVARFSWNWALAEWRRQYAAHRADPGLPRPTEAGLRRDLNRCKRSEFPWMYDVSKCAAQEAVIDLGMAFRSFFAKRARYPRFKKKGVARDSFCAANQAGTFRVEGRRIRLPRIGWVRMREALRFSGTPKRVTVSREADRWFAAILVDTPDRGPGQADDLGPVAHPGASVGVDLGVKTLAVLSTGEAIAGPKAHRRLLAALRRRSRALSRKRKGSANRRKAQARLARLHARISHIRQDATHKATTRLAKGWKRIGIEDLNVRGMAANRRLARSIMDGGFHEFRRQLEYKASIYGSTVVLADRWYPSSRTCSCCGSVKAGLALSERVFRCDGCGMEIDRDLNAAKNLDPGSKSPGQRSGGACPGLRAGRAGILAASSAVSACGEACSGASAARLRAGTGRVKQASVKQEPNGSVPAFGPGLAAQLRTETASYA